MSDKIQILIIICLQLNKSDEKLMISAIMSSHSNKLNVSKTSIRNKWTTFKYNFCKYLFI